MRAKDLKNSILQLAVSGKLVPQDASDEPAIKLLERIRAERESLIKQKKIKNTKLEPITEEDIPFEVPESWEWVRLGELLSLVSDGTHKTPQYTEDGVLFLSVQNISKGYFDLTKVKHVSQQTHDELCKRVKPSKGDILLCRIGTLGKPIIVDVNYEFSIFVSLGLLRPIAQELATWIVLSIDSPVGFNWIERVKVGGGTHTFKINLGDIPNFLLPLPPLAEQKRIVQKVQELMPLVEEYGELEEAREKVDAELPSLLKKSVLQQAVQGTLVPQDATDEPAVKLFERIRAERESLIKQKKIKNTKVDPITDEDIPFEVPVSWEWVRLGEISKIVNGFTPKRSEPTFWENGTIPWFTAEDIHNQGRIITYTEQSITEKALGNRRMPCPEDTVLLCCTASIGEVALAKIPLITNQQYNAIVQFGVNGSRALPEYIFYWAQTLKETLNEVAGTTTFPFVSVSKLEQFLLPLPPLAEQKRIVQKVREVMGVVG